MENTVHAAFKLDSYRFSKVSMNLKDFKNANIHVDFLPSGTYYKEKNRFQLSFQFKASIEKTNIPFIDLQCESTFSFVNVNSLEEIPPFFYANSIAILFPYIRAFVSTLTLQANVNPLILPTYNLTSLETKFKGNIKEV